MIVHLPLPRTLTPKSLERLEVALFSALANDQARAILLVGEEEGAFCEGLDFQALDEPARKRQEAVERFARVLATVRGAGIVVLAFVDGSARGGGVGLAAAADWVIASDAASFSLPEVPMGLLPAMILPVLLERAAPARARQLALSGESLDAEAARAMGLVDEIASVEELERLAKKHARRLGRGRPAVIAKLKAYCASVVEESVMAGIETGREITADDLQDDTVVEPILEFVRGGAPPWRAR